MLMLAWFRQEIDGILSAPLEDEVLTKDRRAYVVVTAVRHDAEQVWDYDVGCLEWIMICLYASGCSLFAIPRRTPSDIYPVDHDGTRC